VIHPKINQKQLGRVLVIGSSGMVGSAFVRLFESSDHCSSVIGVSRADADLLDASAVRQLLSKYKVDWVILAAARVGGIGANSAYPVEFLSENLKIELNVIEAAYRAGVSNLLFLGSSCIYPKFATQPISENQFLAGSLEPTNESYAIAKIAGIKLCAAYHDQYGMDYRCVMPCNLYGPADTYHESQSHVIPSLILKMHQAVLAGVSEVSLWGSGTPKREFLFVDELVDACHILMQLSTTEYSNLASDYRIVNIGSGYDISIADLAKEVAKVVGFGGDIVFNTSMPDGTPRKILDVTKMSSIGWHPKIDLRSGLETTYSSFAEEHKSFGKFVK